MSSITFENVMKRFPDGTVAVHAFSLEVREGEFLILVGPSGCGKTTLLRMLAGLETVTSGEIYIGDRLVNDVDPSSRDVAMVFQSYALYPHMSVADNIAFPLRQQRVPKAEVNERLAEVAQMLRIEELLDRKPRALSGGQRQRVAIGRALIRKPKAFLMDEPLSNLDAKLRVQMRAELNSLHRRLGITTVYVTHDQTEAMTLGERVVVMNNGRVNQIDTPNRLYDHQAEIFVAAFIGSPPINLIEGCIRDGCLTVGGLDIPLNCGAANGDVVVGARPEDVRIVDDGSKEGVEATVEITEPLGPEALVYLHAPRFTTLRLDREIRLAEGADALIVARVDPTLRVRPGQAVRLQLNADRLKLFDPASGAGIGRIQPPSWRDLR